MLIYHILNTIYCILSTIHHTLCNKGDPYVCVCVWYFGALSSKVRLAGEGLRNAAKAAVEGPALHVPWQGLCIPTAKRKAQIARYIGLLMVRV